MKENNLPENFSCSLCWTWITNDCQQRDCKVCEDYVPAKHYGDCGLSVPAAEKCDCE